MKRYMRIGLVLVFVVLLLSLAGEATVDAGCPEPVRENVVYLANVQQAHVDGMWACFEHPYRCLDK